MRFTVFTLFLLSFSLTAMAQSLSITEHDLPQLVRENNSLVEAGRKEVESFDKKTGHLARSFIPKISIQFGQENFKYVTSEYRTQPYYRAGAEFNIYNGGKDQYKSKINNVEFEKSQAEQKINLFSQLESARKTFWKALFLKKMISQYNKALALIKKNKKSALKRIRGGVATKSDRYEFEIKEVELKQDKKKAELELEKLMGHLKVLIGAKQDQTLTLNQELAHDHNWRRLVEHSEDDHNYLLKPEEFNVKKMDLTSTLAGRSWLPKLDAYAIWLQNNQRADIDRVNENERQQTAFGLRASWSFADFFSSRVQSQSAFAQSEASKMKLQFQKRELENELHMELKELELLDSMAHDAEENIKRSQKFFKLITDEYKRGIKTSGDMLMATEKLISSEIRLMIIIKDFQMAKAHIMTKLGE